ncbi:MAG: hydroxyphenylacetyl-CoA thioesterase PaaI [Betaproteobacteria bacterium]|nr:hydroxyphenylacetyl-CoA thioesterase PaaI [Betaproteobacteria bacterium]
MTEHRGEAEARERVEYIASRDPFIKTLGIRLVEAGFGHARVAFTVAHKHLNFGGSCHGGVLFSLADTAFGLASNSHGALAVGIDTHMTFSVAVREGDVLTASAKEISRTRRLGIYRVEVTREDGALVAAFTGTVYISSRTIDEQGGPR